MFQGKVQDAKIRLRDLLVRVERALKIVACRAGVLVAVADMPPRVFGGDCFVVPDDFDGALPEVELTSWE